MENTLIVRPEHLNHFGFLFGGQMLKWVDETAWVAASLENPGCNLVTRAMESCEFHEKVASGTILRFETNLEKTGKTSLVYKTEVFALRLDGGETKNVFSTRLTFVCIDENGDKRCIPECECKGKR